MNKPFRLARPDDYTYIPEIGMWELNFDKRPVKGVRCEDPTSGADEYNQARIKFFDLSKNASKDIDLDYKFNFESLLLWANNSGTPEQCRFIIKLFRARNISEYKKTALDFISNNKEGYPYHLDIAVFFTGFNTRVTAKTELIQQVEKKAYDEES
ncbi:hypothetical protein VRR38_004711 [Salmonella enterica]|nr:hypothetical protein [Salmonella enterica]EMD7130158.1 hypothetical protein [Salmonella enterica]